MTQSNNKQEKMKNGSWVMDNGQYGTTKQEIN